MIVISNENRKYKDTVFADLFYLDRNAKENLLSLYNALFDENLTDPELISLVRLENTLFMEMNNDVAFTVGNRKIILAEHQASINENMPLRNLLYLAREYEQYFPTEVRYKKKRVQVPTPEFFTFYNGAGDYPMETVLKLSDSFMDTTDHPSLDLTVRVININYPRRHKLLSKCEILKQYSQFISIVRDMKGQEHSLEEAVKKCISEGILAEYLNRKGSEVVNMLMAEYDYATDIRVQREEAKEENSKEIAIRMHENKLPDELISKITGFSLEALGRFWPK